MIETCPSCGATLDGTPPDGACRNCSAKTAHEPADLTYSFVPNESGRVLDTLTKNVGPMPRVLLPDTGGGQDVSPVVRPMSTEMPTAPQRVARVQLLGEIARGGMGAVLKGRDPDLGRDLAVKVLLEVHRENPDLVRRFVEEAQIGGQLQHPGIVPVYELGTFGDSRPYFTMKLVKGRTLADLLGARKDPADELPKFLGIFEQIAQTVAYAHARGVIHRDLKPSNVMVGSFGEVQVMDWGLAKVLPKGGAVDDASAGKLPPQETVIATARSGSDDSDLSHAGSVMGTPSYMAPEQARGEVDRVDERSDVFALGSILVEVLTGQPAFTGRSSGEIQRTAALGDTADALARLDRCGTDADLIALAKDCLRREPDDRPSDAGVVSERITAYLSSVQERLRAAERDRAVAEATAVEERKRRKLQLGLAASVLALMVVGGLATASILQRRQARIARIDRALSETTTLLAQARQNPEEILRWKEAIAAARRVEDPEAAGPAASHQLSQALAEAQDGLQTAERDAKLRQVLVDVRANQQDAGPSGTHDAYSAAFREAGLDLDPILVPEAAAWLQKKSPSVIVELSGYLDHWALMRKAMNLPAVIAYKPLELAKAADKDPYRNQIRMLLTGDDPKISTEFARLVSREASASGSREEDGKNLKIALKTLANDPRSGDLPPSTALLLAYNLDGPGEAVDLLRKVVAHHPDDVWVNFELAGFLNRLRPALRDEAVRFYTAARSLRPETSHDLAHLLDQMGRGQEAEAIFRDLCLRRPDDARHLTCFGCLLIDRDRKAEANELLDRSIEIARRTSIRSPDQFDGHFALGRALVARGQTDAGIASLSEAVRINPNSSAQPILAAALFEKQEFDGSIVAYQKAINLQPDSAYLHYRLGMSFLVKNDVKAIGSFREAIRLKPDYPDAYLNLSTALLKGCDFIAACDAYLEACRLQPDNASQSLFYGNTMLTVGNREGAAKIFREAARLRPDDAVVHKNLAVFLFSSGDKASAKEEYKRVVRLKPDDPEAHYTLANASTEMGEVDAAAAEYREAIRLKPDYAEAHCNLGQLLKGQGEYAEALSELRKGHELGSKRQDWQSPSADWLRLAEQESALAPRLSGVLNGSDKPANAAESLAFGGICTTRKRFAASSRLFADAFTRDPSLSQDLTSGHRYNAACYSILAASGKGKDDPPLDDGAKAKLRDQARAWLKADLALWEKKVDGGQPGDLESVRNNLTHWKADFDLAGIRDAAELARLTEAEREGWRAFWAEVDAMLARATK